MNTTSSTCIDCHFMLPEQTAAYLVTAERSAAFVDNNTPHALPRLLAALHDAGKTPEDVRYLIVTHVHLDHAAGTAALLEVCPNAEVLAHPRTVRHLINPDKLVRSAKMVYGEETFAKVYGHMAPVPEDRVRAVAEGESVWLDGHTLTFHHAPGHAKHHILIHDESAGVVYTGDSFGVSLPFMQAGGQPYVLCSTPPTDFEPEGFRETMRRLLELKPSRIALSHYGYLDDPMAQAESLGASVGVMESALWFARDSGLVGDDLVRACEDHIRPAIKGEVVRCQCPMDATATKWLADNVHLNAQGIAFSAERLRAPKGI